MKAVFKREFKALFFNMSAILSLCAYLSVFGILFVAYNLNFGYPDVTAVYLLGAVPATIICAILGCSAFYEERKNQCGRFLEMLPLSRKDILLGKYFARVAFIMIPTAISAVFPIVLDVFGEINYIGSYSMLFALCIYQTFVIAVSIMFSALLKNIVLPFVYTYGIFAVCFFLPYIPTLISPIASENVLMYVKNITVFLSPYAQMDYFSIGIFDIRKIVWLIVFTVAALIVSCLYMKEGINVKEERKS